MSNRLRNLLAEIEAAPSMRPACERWADLLREEIAEREAPLEEGLAKIAKQLDTVGAFFHTVVYKPGGSPVEATVTVNTAADALRALALRGARSAPPAKAQRSGRLRQPPRAAPPDRRACRR